MICSKSELASNKVGTVLFDKGYHSQELSPGDTVLSLRLSQQSAAIGYDSLLALVIHLGQNSADASITDIGVQDE